MRIQVKVKAPGNRPAKVRHVCTGCLLFLLVALFAACRQQEDNPQAGGQATPVADSDAQSAGAQPDISGRDAAAADDPASESEEPQPTPVTTPAPFSGARLVLCMSSKPATLFPYGDNSPTAVALRGALYEPLVTSTGFAYQARALEKLPSLADGDAQLVRVMVQEGDRVVDANGKVVMLTEDTLVRDADGEEVVFDGTPLEMIQMVVDFVFKPLVWSDGVPVTAADSVFSYNVAVAPETAFASNTIQRTASYVGTGPRGTRWTGLPGFLDQTYFLNAWTPLPRHQLQDVPLPQLATSPLVSESPLSSGPFVLAAGTEEGDAELVLKRNPHYYRQSEGLPRLDEILVRFGQSADFLASGADPGCDVIDDSVLTMSELPVLQEASANGEWDLLVQPGTVYEQIAFGIDPEPEYAEGRPDWFEDARVRQAITQCTDRARMVEELTAGFAVTMNGYVPPQHPLYPGDLQDWPYDPERANALLDEAGYVDFDGDGRRQDLSTGVPMTITLGTNSESGLRIRINEILQENLAGCGIPVETYTLPAGSWYAEGPLGRVFGRSFDLASLAWIGRVLPDCGLFHTANISGPPEQGYGGWRGVNVTGWSNEAFDAACGAALAALPGGEGYDENQQQALRIFNAELPAVPLFTSVKLAAVRPGVSNVRLDSSEPSLLWNVAEWDLEE